MKQLQKFRCRKQTPPSLTRIKETLYKIDAEDFDRKVNGWLASQALANTWAPAIAVDGKVLRGSKDNQRQTKAVYLLSALLHREKITVAQRSVDDKTNEIPEVLPLLADLDLCGVFVTFDAIHCQKATMAFIEEKQGYFVVTVKKNQPILHDHIESAFELFSDSVASACEEKNRGHGRIEIRRVQTIEVGEDVVELDFPYIRQVCRIERVVSDLKNRPLRHEIAYAVTNALPATTTSADLLTIIRQHWHIENSSKNGRKKPNRAISM